MHLDFNIGERSRCFIIAEAGVNHNGNLGMALKLVDAAKSAGADAVKFQTFKAEKLVSPEARMADYQKKNIGKTESQFDMLKRLELSEENHRKIFKYCKEKGIMFISSPFDNESADFLDELGVKIFKVGSGELTNIPFLQHIARKKKPMIISTGMANIDEIRTAVNTIKKINPDIVILHCTSSYPANFAELNLNVIKTLKKTFNIPVGYSDHSEGIESSIAAIALGASVIEKHFTLDKNLSGPDHKASIEPEELKKMVTCIRNIEKALGDGVKKPSMSEQGIMKCVRKSIFAKVNIEKGTLITEKMLEFKRPGTGIPPSEIVKIIGRKIKKSIQAGKMLQNCHVNNKR